MRKVIPLLICLFLVACKRPAVISPHLAAQWQGLYQAEIREERLYIKFELQCNEDLSYELALYDLRYNQKERFKGQATVDSNSLFFQLKNGTSFKISENGLCESSQFQGFKVKKLEPDSNYFYQSWRLIQLENKYLAMDLQNDLTISFLNDTLFGGFSGCNSYGGILEKDLEAKLRLKKMNTTLLYCEGAMELEEHFTNSLLQVRAYRFKDPEHLNLLDSNGKALVYLRRVMLLD